MIRKDILGKRLNNETFVINTATKEVGYIVENNRIRCISLLDKSNFYQTHDKTVEDFSEWCGIRADSVTIKQYECLKYNVWLDKKDDRRRHPNDDVTFELYRKYDRLSSASRIKKITEYLINSGKIVVSIKEIGEYLKISPHDVNILMSYLIEDEIACKDYDKKLGFVWYNTYYFLVKNKEKALELLS